MVGILVVTHGYFGKELIKSAELIVGDQPNISALCLNHGDDIELLRESIKEEIIKLNQDDGIIVFTDLFGGTPSNLVFSNMRDLEFESISGVNLPMLIEALMMRSTGLDLESIIENCMREGVNGIQNAKLKLFE